MISVPGIVLLHSIFGITLLPTAAHVTYPILVESTAIVAFKPSWVHYKTRTKEILHDLNKLAASAIILRSKSLTQP